MLGSGVGVGRAVGVGDGIGGCWWRWELGRAGWSCGGSWMCMWLWVVVEEGCGGGSGVEK